MTYAELICPTKGPGGGQDGALAVVGRGPDEPRRRLDTRASALALSRNAPASSARREMIEYLISRTMGNQRRHTASLLAVHSPPAVRLSVCPTCSPWASKAAGAPPPDSASTLAFADARASVCELKAQRRYVSSWYFPDDGEGVERHGSLVVARARRVAGASRS